jgi:acyl-CoA thioester hydrolase
MADWMECHRAVAFPWNCDHIGHLNVRWYAHFFDDAGFHLWSRIGVSHATLKERGLATVIARTTTDFIHEIRAGELIVVESAFTRLGTKSLDCMHRMKNAENGTLCATQHVVEVFFDPEARKPCAMPDDLRTALQAILVDRQN